MPGRMLLHPVNIPIIGTSYVQCKSRRERRRGPAIEPFVDFGMAVSESKPGCTVMITAGVIDNLCCQNIWVAIHLDHEIGIVNTILALVQDYEGHSWTRVIEGAELAKYGPLTAIAPTAAIIGRRITITSDPVAH